MLETKDSRPNAASSTEFNQHGPAASGLSPQHRRRNSCDRRKVRRQLWPKLLPYYDGGSATVPSGAVDLVITIYHSRDGSGFRSYSTPKCAIDS